MREDGYYWVKLGEAAEPEMGLWRNDLWWLTGRADGLPDEGMIVAPDRKSPPPADGLSFEARSILECEGAWNEAGALELIKVGLAVPTQVEFTVEGERVARALRDSNGSARPGT